MQLVVVCLTFSLLPCTFSKWVANTQPEQIHLSYPGDPTQMFVTWSTMDPTPSGPQVYYGTEPTELNAVVNGTATRFKVSWFRRSEYIHRVMLTRLVPGTIYYYRVGSSYGWSTVYSFRALKPRAGGYRLAVYGDMGTKNARSLYQLIEETTKGDIDMILHVGDFAYNMNFRFGHTGDQFMRQIEPIASRVPYMTVPGNHESWNNFSQYVNRFTMPGPAKVYYSFDLGLAHFIGFSTELYFSWQLSRRQKVENQYKWLENDLKKAQANRHNVPWVITMGHRPMYCSSKNTNDCTKYESVTRTGASWCKQFGLEDLFYKYGVDLEIWAHEHSYERLWAIYNRTVYNGTRDPYNGPPAPVHLITGSAGCRETHDYFTKVKPPWSGFRNNDYGYSRMVISNETHLYWEQFSIDKAMVIDKIWLRKDTHGPYSNSIRHRHGGGGTFVPYDFVVEGDKTQ